jgi:uncharacterized membrane protein YphA (DoxX/SURF4 family)
LIQAQLDRVVLSEGNATERSSNDAGRAQRRTVTVRSAIARSDASLRRDPIAVRVALLTGTIFIFAGLVKFVFHGWELHAFRSFGLPWPSALEIFAGLLEIAGGLLLLARTLVVPAALLLAVTMLVAIGASGIGHGDVIPSLTLAPALLVALLFMLARMLRLDRAPLSPQQ